MGMPREVQRDEVWGLAASGVPVVEVLPRSEYRWRHIAGARSLPLAGLTWDAVGALDPGRPVIVYCKDFE
jgi:rhodanese-related sulfurtransferase